MVYIEEFGFKIFRLKDEKADREFILFNLKNKNYSFLTKKRLIEILKTELRDKDINLKDFIMKTFDLTYQQANENIYLNKWIDEELILINELGFRATKEIIFEKDNKKYFNTFEFIETLNKENYKNKISFDEFKKLAPNHYNLFQNLHNFDDLAIQDTLLKIADKLKYPNEKAQDCIIFYPGEGAGKGIFFKYVLQPIFNKYVSKVLMKRLNSEFNEFLRKPLILVLEEGKRDLNLIETLKEVTTESTILINEKGKNQKEEEIRFLTFVFSNNMNPIDLGKRRGSYHLTHSLGKNIKESQEKGRKLCEQLPNETEILLNYLHNLEFEHQEALMPYNTKAKLQVNDLNKSPVELFYDFLISFNEIDKAFIDLSNKTGKNFELVIEKFKPKIKDADEENYISKDLFKDAYNQFCEIEGLKSNIIRHNKDIVQLWALMKINEDAHQRITVKYGKNEGRKIDHIRLKDVQEHLKEVLENE